MNRLIPSSRRLVAAASALVFALATPLWSAPTDPESPVRLGSNENAFGYTPKAKEAMIAAIESSNYYNRNEVEEMVKIAAAKEGVQPDFIYPTAGSGPVLELTAAAFSKPGLNIVTTTPGYPQLTGSFTKWGGTIKYTPVNAKMGYDFTALLAAIDENTAIVYICNPNNPTGVLADPAELRKFVMMAPPHVLVFVDEAYLELADTGLLPNTVAPLVKLRKNLIVSRTFSKAYALAGLRAGYGIGHPETLAKLKKYDLGLAPSFLAAIAAQEAMKDQEYMELNRKRYAEVRNYTKKELDRLGLTYADPQGAFVLFKSGMESGEVVKKMLAENIMVTRPFGIQPGDEAKYADWVRVSLGTKEEMQLFVSALEKTLGKN